MTQKSQQFLSFLIRAKKYRDNIKELPIWAYQAYVGIYDEWYTLAYQMYFLNLKIEKLI